MSTQPVEALNTLPITALESVTEEQLEVINTRQNKLLERANALVINNADTKQVAWDLLNGIAELRKDIENDFKESKSAAHKAWKAICEQEKGHLEKLTEPDRILREKLSTYETECRRLQEELDRQAREAAKAEQERLQREAAEAARLAQEQAQREAEEKRLNEAIAAEEAGKPEVAQAILETPVAVAPVVPIVVPTVPIVVPHAAGVSAKVEGQGSMVENWYFEVTDDKAIPREYLLVNEEAIGKIVKALKGATNIPGIRAYSKLEPRVSGRRR